MPTKESIRADLANEYSLEYIRANRRKFERRSLGKATMLLKIKHCDKNRNYQIMSQRVGFELSMLCRSTRGHKDPDN